mmetsp:Transcript_40002/g.45891  ORF Transcript_40002/g.45891 Transcript_40002/m.45891 type:complete len:97 (-) Transcript_40002:7-297(-)
MEKHEPDVSQHVDTKEAILEMIRKRKRSILDQENSGETICASTPLVPYSFNAIVNTGFDFVSPRNLNKYLVLHEKTTKLSNTDKMKLHTYTFPKFA